MTGIVAIIMVFSIPIVAIVTSHLQKQSKIKHKMIQDELELEKLKHDNYVIETQKLRIELEQMKLEESKDKPKIM
ncbi:hypothetical protein BGM26_15690 [Bacillus sp. FJAT-29790]|uniref:hypothetical protein n=1 Tax=Bacillus sp. FJAT-29790 TaxID=1895002 RepID=UPI001C225D0D|nr:hypothetical protein [Bacillus sp. FJAT-29790]MBU8880395.1 hypothetical protein [Bacillus sp. FJAT-29790]